jgi:geranylgeranyl pyrophosphate synthase
VNEAVDRKCEELARLMESALADTPLGPVASDFMRELGSGKMLRGRMAIELGEASGAEQARILNIAAAVEMIHAASLVHDDVIDGGTLRRGVPTFWLEHGVQGAILFGDMLLFKAIQMVRKVGDPALLETVIDLTGEVCIAEVQQELVLRGGESDWETCISLARRKTGALFAISAYAAGTDAAMALALKEAGYLIGTAYQLCDDMLDVGGDEELARKSLGSDSARRKTTAASVAGADRDAALTIIAGLVEDAARQLAPWPRLSERWKDFCAKVINPVLESFVGV